MQADRPLPFFQESCTKSGALLLKHRIESYWRERGYLVNCELRAASFDAAMRAARWDVRSDLVNGLPRLRLTDKPISVSLSA